MCNSVIALPLTILLPLTACGAAINLASFKEHAVECKMKLAKVRRDVERGSPIICSSVLVSKLEINKWKEELNEQVILTLTSRYARNIFRQASSLFHCAIFARTYFDIVSMKHFSVSLSYLLLRVHEMPLNKRSSVLKSILYGDLLSQNVPSIER